MLIKFVVVGNVVFNVVVVVGNVVDNVVVVSEFLCAKVSLVTQCVLFAGHKTISHSFMALTK